MERVTNLSHPFEAVVSVNESVEHLQPALLLAGYHAAVRTGTACVRVRFLRRE